jgi:hypothetical protein
MRTLSRTVACPLCGRPAQLVLFQDDSAADHVEPHEIGFTCPARHPVDPEILVLMWAEEGPHTNPA